MQQIGMAANVSNIDLATAARSMGIPVPQAVEIKVSSLRTVLVLAN